ncbi:DnaJ domain-containing protein [Romeria aff. gracilis LEGE 07310]|uniref:DnaJ domain-containing protein n=1 Tax=Vasconcelosia minhoensis LEGE 07310 TaxID=915328 RepID=A0A8J7DAM7_9CYAN|nr:J domain-containing protein [Romeria gracilis]MBE9076627.1 DnaJ domain-containing protein [Romeria aff. gracilis LEGE 07310]
MSLADHYRTLGLRTGASFADIKSSYRQLARQYHPDVNPTDQQAKDRFIQITHAYNTLVEKLQPKRPVLPRPDRSARATVETVKTVFKTETSPPPQRAETHLDSHLSHLDRQIKQTAYIQLQLLLREKKFPRAIALVEGLAQRLPQDPEVRQWQAITYQRWARDLISQRQYAKARVYLQKALRSDPHNRSLWAEVNRDFWQLEQKVRQTATRS